MYTTKNTFNVWYMINEKENYSSIREVCRRGEFSNFYSLEKRRV